MLWRWSSEGKIIAEFNLVQSNPACIGGRGRGGGLLYGQQPVFYITLAEACGPEGILQCLRKATTQHEK